MMRILHVSCSPRGRAAESDRLARRIIGHLLEREPSAIVIDRPVGGGAIPHVDEDYATVLGAPPQPSAPSSAGGSLALSEALIREVEEADVLLIATPMHNFTTPSGLKAWLDHVVRAHRTFRVTGAGKIGALRDRPVLVAISSGGLYSGERARQPDFLTPYLRAILGTIGLHDLTFFSVEGSAFGPDALTEARAMADHGLRLHFSSPLHGTPAPVAVQLPDSTGA
jgi:FMN-dependent NADH-azoreductase